MNRWPNPQNTAHLKAEPLQGAPNRRSIHADQEDLDASSKPWKKAGSPRQKPSSGRQAWLESPSTKDVKAALVAKGNRHPRPRSQRQRVPGPPIARVQQARPRQGHPAMGQNPPATHRQPCFEPSSGLRAPSCRNNHGPAEYKQSWCSPDLHLKYISAARKSIGVIGRGGSKLALFRPGAPPLFFFGDYEGANLGRTPTNNKAKTWFWCSRLEPAGASCQAQCNRPRSHS